MYEFFLGEDPFVTEQSRQTVSLLLAPLEQTTSFEKGTARGPQRIIEVSDQVEFYDVTLDSSPGRANKMVVDTTLQHGLNDTTDGSAADLERALKRIEKRLVETYHDGQVPFILGGEHTVTIAALRALIKYQPTIADQLTVVQLDAHADLRSKYAGRTLCHASVMRQALAEFSDLRVVQVGIRAICEEERDFIATSPRIASFTMQQLRQSTSWQSAVLSQITTPLVYLTFDIDALDPSIMPATGTPVVGGLQWYETVDFLRELFAAKSVVAADCVEFMPLPGVHHADMTAAQLVHTIIGLGLKPLSGIEC